MRAVRKDYFLDHDHSAYVDQWDWERVITADQRNLDYLEGDRARDLAGPARAPSAHVQELFPAAPRPSATRTCPRRSRSSTPRTSSIAIPTCRASSARP